MAVHHKETPRVAEIMDRLQAELSAGLIPIGTRLNEQDLAQRFGASRTPVRSALSALATLDIIVAKPGGGHFVPDPTTEELANLFEAMHEVELFAIRMAKKRLGLLARQKIEKAQEKCKQARERSDFLTANEEFHLAIYDATRNVYLADIARTFRIRTGAVRARRYQSQSDIEGGIEGHDIMVRYLFDDPDALTIGELSRLLARRFADDLEHW